MQKLSDEAKRNKYNYINEYHKNKYHRVSLNLTNEQYDIVKSISDRLEISVNAFIKSAVDEKIKSINDQS